MTILTGPGDPDIGADRGQAAMKRLSMIVVVAGAALMVGRHLAQGGRWRIDLAAMRRRMMERMMKGMPEDSPPKLIVSILPRLREQNEQILALLKQQNDLLRRLNRSP
jgi:hypothetical protein